MASTTSSANRILSSPRGQRWLYWISGIVFVAGLAAFIAVYATRGSSKATVQPSPQTQTPPAQSVAKVHPSKAAFKIARQFLETAVLRKDLAASYKLVGPQLKGGMTLKQWKTGNIPVQPYPAENAKTTALVVNYSHPAEISLTVSLVAKPGAGVKPQSYYVVLDRAGGKKNGRWLVNNFSAQYQAPVLPGGQ